MDTRQLNDVLRNAIEDVKNLDKDKLVKVKGGKEYAPVKERNAIFRKHFGMDVGYTTTYEIRDPQILTMRDKEGKSIDKFFPGSVVCKTEIFYKNKFLATGIAEEIRGSNPVNMTSALENCQTSSLGRALAMLDLTGSEFASADEMQIAQRKNEELKYDIASERNEVASNITEDNKHTNENKSSNIDVAAAISAAKHLGQLNRVMMDHAHAIEHDAELTKLFQQTKAKMERGTPKGKDDDWYE